MFVPTQQAIPMSARPSRSVAARLAAVLAVAALAVLVGGGQVSAQTLTEALANAYNTNPQLLAQRALLRTSLRQLRDDVAGNRE